MNVLSFRTIFGAVAALLMVANLYLIFVVAPTDAAQGEVARVIYLHVPVAIMSFLAFFFVFVGSVMYLIKRDLRWDSLAHSAAEVGVVFISVAALS